MRTPAERNGLKHVDRVCPSVVLGEQPSTFCPTQWSSKTAWLPEYWQGREGSRRKVRDVSSPGLCESALGGDGLHEPKMLALARD